MTRRRADQVIKPKPLRKVQPGMAREYGLNHRAWRKLAAEFRALCAARRLPCWLCNTEIDYTQRTGRWAFEADHYHPRATHPHLMMVMANLRASHRACNRARQAKVVDPQSEWVRPEW